MLFKSLCFFLLFIINNAFANSEKPDHFDQKTSFILNNYFSNYNLLGHAKYKYLFFDIYDASLVSQEENFNNILIINQIYKKPNYMQTFHTKYLNFLTLYYIFIYCYISLILYTINSLNIIVDVLPLRLNT